MGGGESWRRGYSWTSSGPQAVPLYAVDCLADSAVRECTTTLSLFLVPYPLAVIKLKLCRTTKGWAGVENEGTIQELQDQDVPRE